MKTILAIQNLKCGGCAHTIITKIKALNTITDVTVNIEKSTVSFSYDTVNDLEVVVHKLLTLGYPVEGDENSVLSKAKSFVSCATGKITK